MRENVIGKFTELAKSIGQNIGELKYYCGNTTLVNRRKRSLAKEIVLNYAIIEKGSKEKIKADPVGELSNLKKILENTTAPKSIAEFKKPRDWSVLNKYVKKLISVATDGKPATGRCSEVGVVQRNNAKINERCGMIC